MSNASSSGRAWWVSVAGPFHNFPSLPARAAGTRCALGQLTPRGLLQMITIGKRSLLWQVELNNKQVYDEIIDFTARSSRICDFQALILIPLNYLIINCFREKELFFIFLGNILREAYGEKLNLEIVEPQGKKDTGKAQFLKREKNASC